MLFCGGERLFVLFVFPSLFTVIRPSAVSALLEKYGADRVVFGHVHSARSGWEPFELNGVQYILTAGDYINFKPVLICP